MNFKKRSYEKELLDRQDIPFEDIRKNMEELDLINRWLGGHRITVRGLKHFLQRQAGRQSTLSIVEIGCGGGDNLRVIREALQSKKIPFQLTGVDINPACISYARQHGGNYGIEFICSDYKATQFSIQPDIIFSSLFCHHFSDPELVDMLQWMFRKSRLGFFINDLHRHPVAYYSIKGLTAAFSKSYLVKNDGPLSVLRGFSREDWLQLFRQAGITGAACNWQWAFRWLVSCSK